MNLAIKKLGYSRSQWRLVDLDRVEFGKPVEIAISVEFDHPECGATTIDEAVSGDTKAECVEKVLQFLGRLIEASMERDEVK